MKCPFEEFALWLRQNGLKFEGSGYSNWNRWSEDMWERWLKTQ